MGECPHQPEVPDQLLQVVARLTELDAAAFDGPDAEALPDERVQPHAAGRELAARLAGGERDPVLGGQELQLLALDERQLPLGVGAGLEVAVALQARAGDRLHPVDRVHGTRLDRGEVDGDDRGGRLLGHGRDDTRRAGHRRARAAAPALVAGFDR